MCNNTSGEAKKRKVRTSDMMYDDGTTSAAFRMIGEVWLCMKVQLVGAEAMVNRTFQRREHDTGMLGTEWLCIY